jgi:cysteine-S-conjugate beta-lyase
VPAVPSSPDDGVLRRRRSLKWSRARPGEIPADFAELDFDVAPSIQQALEEHVALQDYGYPDLDRGISAELAEVFGERYGYTPSRVEFCAQIVQALCAVILTMTRPGEAVLLHEPAYPPYTAAVRALGRRVITVPVGAAVPTNTDQVALVVLCHPHNPTGRLFETPTLAGLAATGAPIFWDAVYQDLVFERAEFTPPTDLPVLADRVIMFTSAAKSFNIPGLRCAVGHFPTPELLGQFRRLPWHLRSGAGLLGLSATLAAWKSGNAWLAGLVDLLRQNRSHVAAAVSSWAGVDWTPPDAGFLGWLRFDDTAGCPATLLRERTGVALQPGSTYGDAFRGYARLNFGTSPERLARILERLTDGIS